MTPALHPQASWESCWFSGQVLTEATDGSYSTSTPLSYSLVCRCAAWKGSNRQKEGEGNTTRGSGMEVAFTHPRVLGCRIKAWQYFKTLLQVILMQLHPKAEPLKAQVPRVSLGLAKMQILGQDFWGGASDAAFLTSSRVTQGLLVEDHLCARGTRPSMLIRRLNPLNTLAPNSCRVSVSTLPSTATSPSCSQLSESFLVLIQAPTTIPLLPLSPSSLDLGVLGAHEKTLWLPFLFPPHVWPPSPGQ